MNVNFPPIDENFIKSKVADGYYSNATELVRDAVRRLRESSNSKHEKLIAALALGEQDVREGRVIPYTPELMDEIEKEAIHNLKNGKKLRPEVTGE